MKRAAAKTTTETTPKHQESPSPISGLTLAVQLLDTTFRVAIPIVVLSLFGKWLDGRYHTKPALTISGLVLSLLIATVLVYRQIKIAYPDFFNKDDKPR